TQRPRSAAIWAVALRTHSVPDEAYVRAMAQCVGRSQRTGEQCKRSAAAGASTCYYHGPGAGRVKETRRRVEPQGRRAFTTKVLSRDTWADFETLFAVGTGWG